MMYYCVDERVYFRGLVQVCVSVSSQNAQLLGTFNHYVTLNLTFFRPPFASFETVYNDHCRPQLPDKVRYYVSFPMDFSMVAGLNQYSGWATIPETNSNLEQNKFSNTETYLELGQTSKTKLFKMQLTISSLQLFSTKRSMFD